MPTILLWPITIILSTAVQAAPQLDSATETTAFAGWLAGQDAVALTRYQRFIDARVPRPPSLLDLTINRHPVKPGCPRPMFAVPPRAQWPRLVPALRLVERLWREGVISDYHFTSLYHSAAENGCVGGASGSKHLQNAAVDFDVVETAVAARAAMALRLCRFWTRNGSALRFGFGAYGDGRFHADVEGYRAWGPDFKRATSPCLPVRLR